MSPEAERARCPFCLASVRLTIEGVFRKHGYVPRRRNDCPSSGRTPEAAKAAKSAGPPFKVLSGPAGNMKGTREVRPEDIF